MEDRLPARVAASTNTRGGAARKMATLEFITVSQDGDDGLTVIFAVEHFLTVTKIFRPLRRPQMTVAQKAAAIERLAKYAFSPAAMRPGAGPGLRPSGEYGPIAYPRQRTIFPPLDPHMTLAVKQNQKARIDMGMDLHGAQGYFRFNKTSWNNMLTLARQNGWKPERSRSYYALNEHQPLTRKDATGLANALEKALHNIPNEDALASHMEFHPYDEATSTFGVVKHAIGQRITFPECDRVTLVRYPVFCYKDEVLGS